jgi:hypothetical protein
MNSNTPNHASTMQRIHDRLVQGRYWTYSLLIHAVLLAIISTWVISRVNEPDDFVLKGEFPYVPQAQPPEREAEPAERPADPKTEAPRTERKETAVTENRIPIELPKVRNPVSIGQVIDVITVKVEAPNGVAAPAGIPSDYEGRFIKNAAGQITGSNWPPTRPKPGAGTENAVLRGLKWLRDHQNEDGSWSERNKAGMTGLALLCFLGHGELGNSKEFGFCVSKAVQWLLDKGTAHEGRLSMTRDGWGPGNGGVYEHGIVTYALGEYYTLSGDERVLELLKDAIAHIVAGQGPDGGWMYHFDKTQSDTSVSGWQVQALKAAHLTRLNLPGVDAALDKAMANFDRVQGPNGGYGYRGPEDRYSLTGVGLLCEKFWGHGRARDLRKSVEFIREKSKNEFPVKYHGDKADLYAWYYHTQAILMIGGAAWNDWEAKFQKEIVGSQSSDGSWPVMRAAAHGNLQTDGGLTGAVYRTTFSVLILESYYRYMPTNRADIGAGAPALAAK